MPYFLAFLIIAITAICFYLIIDKTDSDKTFETTPDAKNYTPNAIQHEFRSKGRLLTRPLKYAEGIEDSEELKPVKNTLTDFINRNILSGLIKNSSVYLKDLNTGNYFVINGNEQYSPGSMMKIPIMMAFLKNAENNPAILNEKVEFKKHFQINYNQTYTGEPLKENSTYTISQLLYYLIVYSDNDADILLGNKIDFKVVEDVFKDSKLKPPIYGQQDYLINVKDFSQFLNVLYDASCLNSSMSEYALSLMAKGAYKEGIVKPIDSTVTVAHKFGERGDINEQQLHEFGIVYLKDKPYLLGVMTKANDRSKLSYIISEISRIIYDEFKKQQSVATVH